MSPHYQQKYAALGIQVTVKNGKHAVVGIIDKKWHLANVSKDMSNTNTQV
jgi:hypothetical protein